MIQQYVQESPAKTVLDVTSTIAVIGAFMQWLPHIAAGLSVIWALARLYLVYLEIKIKRKELDK